MGVWGCWRAVLMLWAAVAAGLWGKGASGQVHPIRVTVRECGVLSCRSGVSYGSAVAIGRHNPGKELLLTAGHCVRGEVRRVEVGVGGAWRRGVVLGMTMSEGQDLALLGVECESPLACARIAEEIPAAGSEVTLMGFPQGKAFRSRAGRSVAHRYEWVDLVVGLGSIPGESGGGVFDGEGRLVGIISATAPAELPTHTLATGAGRIRVFLEGVVKGVPECGGTPVTGGGERQPDGCEELRVEVERLKGRLTELERREPAAGPRGEPGPVGPAGPPGEVDGEALRRLERLERTEIPVQVLGPDGGVVDERRYRLGEAIQLRLIPRVAGAGRGSP